MKQSVSRITYAPKWEQQEKEREKNPNSVAPNDRMVVIERWIGKNLKRRGSDLIEILSRYLSGGTEEYNEKPSQDTCEVLWFEPNTSHSQIYSVTTSPTCLMVETCLIATLFTINPTRTALGLNSEPGQWEAGDEPFELLNNPVADATTEMYGMLTSSCRVPRVLNLSSSWWRMIAFTDRPFKPWEENHIAYWVRG
jgi:hypothetical protein